MDNKKHYFFDLDGTLTESRSLITERMTDALHALAGKSDIVVISGATVKQMEKQIPWIKDGSVIVMGQSGNEGMFNNQLTEEESNRILDHINQVAGSSVQGAELEDQLEHRGGQISFSFVGHNADKEKKKAWDPGGAKRREILRIVPFEHDDLEVRIGGTTCLDYSRKGWNKAGNIRRLMEEKGWQYENALYIGDAFFEGGNDAIMKDEMVCIEVSGPSRTLQVIEELLKI